MQSKNSCLRFMRTLYPAFIFTVLLVMAGIKQVEAGSSHVDSVSKARIPILPTSTCSNPKWNFFIPEYQKCTFLPSEIGGASEKQTVQKK